MNLQSLPGAATGQASWDGPGAKTWRCGIPTPQLLEVIAAMRANPALEFHTQSTADRHNVSTFVFIKAFKKLTGLSPQRFHAALRIELAKQLLVDTDRPVTDVSFDVGYNSLGTFVRTFTLMVGLSPTQLRRFARGEYLEPAILETAAKRPEHTDVRLRAAIIDPPTDGLLAAGLFPQGLPSGLPFDGCFINPASGFFELHWVAGCSKASLLAAAVSVGSFDDAWAGRFRSIQVCGLHVTADSGHGTLIRLKLRPLKETDPPFLTPIPLLVTLQSKRSRTPA